MNQAEQSYWEVLDKLYYEVRNNTKGGIFYLPSIKYSTPML